ncbi:hypothetical protein JL721_2028 [Aureococcus anophagefferens]|nr:hypothetical protein JL721_2028 [Aureococcus anophagefferens]
MGRKAESFHVKVAVRVRPLLKHDKEQREVVSVSSDGGAPSVTVVDPDKAFPGKKQEIDYLRADYVRERAYEFDHVYGPGDDTGRVFREAVRPMVDVVLEGVNVTIFAYGQTGSGKTHTMLGHRGETGVMRLTLAEMFGKAKGACRFLVSFVELYNEEIRDLLLDAPIRAHVDHGGQGGLDLREDPVRGPCIAGVTEVAANEVDEVMSLLAAGNGRRTQESTRANSESSRSHAVLQIAIESSDKVPSRKREGQVVKVKRTSKLSMIDLAGSERAAETRNSGARLQEGARINRSLLALGNVINALRKANGGGPSYVNFRDSKLTRLLEDSLGGNCRTLMLAHVGPSSSSFEETLNTLKYAHRARAIKNSVKENLRKIDKPKHKVFKAAAVHPEPGPAPNRPDHGRSKTSLHEADAADPRRVRRQKSKLHKTREVVGQVRAAIELRKTVEALTAGRSRTSLFKTQRRSPARRVPPDGEPSPTLPKIETATPVAAAAEAYAAATNLSKSSHELLRRDPLAFLSDVLLNNGGAAPPPPQVTPTSSSAEPSPAKQTADPRAFDEATSTPRAARECEGLRRAVKRNLDKHQLGAPAEPKPAEKHAKLGLPGGPSHATALLDAEMKIVGLELEKLEIAEAAHQQPETQTDEREVHEMALKKLELQVRLRNNVIRKLVNELEKRGSSGKLRKSRLSHPNISPSKHLPPAGDKPPSPRPASAQDLTPRAPGGGGDDKSGNIFAGPRLAVLPRVPAQGGERRGPEPADAAPPPRGARAATRRAAER